jgi:hypothetical protein
VNEAKQSRQLGGLRIVTIGTLAAMLWAMPATAQHSAQFSWDASVSAGVTVYNYYRAPCTGTVTNDVCSAVGAFVKLNAAPITGTSYTDTTVAAGQKYDAYVTAICPTCSPSESDPSNHRAFVVPLDGKPQPPTNFILALLAKIWAILKTIFA